MTTVKLTGPEVAVIGARLRERIDRRKKAEAAVRAGYALWSKPGEPVVWWPELAPLSKHERAVVKRWLAERITWECNERSRRWGSAR